MKLRSYLIDYGFNRAILTSPCLKQEVINKFMGLSLQCFGIRKSITKDPKIIEINDIEALPNWAPKGTWETLEYNFPISDKVAWDKNGKKIKDEWDNTREI